MSEIYTPREFQDAVSPEGVHIDLYNTDHLRAQPQAKQAEGGDIDIIAKAQSELDDKSARERLANSPEAKIQLAQAQIEAMKQWLRADNTYHDNTIDQIIGGLSVEYDEESQEAVVNGDLYLHSLTSAEGLTLPTTIGGRLYLDDLTSAEGLTLPTTIGGSLHLYDLTSAEGLTLPTTIGGSLYLSSLSEAEKTTLRTKYPHLANKIN